MQATGTGLNSPRKRIASRMSSGPVEQFSPITSTFSASSVASTAEMSVPSSILPPLGSSETEVWIGSVRPVRLEGLAGAEHGGLDLEDVLSGLDDDQIGAAVDQPGGLLGEHRDQLAEADLPERGVLGGGQEARRADRARDVAVLARGLARDLRGLGVDLDGVLAQSPLLELQPGALEGVGLHDFRARLEHRGVDALDHVGAVEDQRLVALALQTAVVLGGELELLERRAHAAVVDDDVAVYRLQVVAGHQAMLAGGGSGGACRALCFGSSELRCAGTVTERVARANPLLEMEPQSADREAALVQAIADGDERAFAASTDASCRSIVGWLYRQTGDREVAADLAAEVFAAALISAHRYRPSRGSAGLWLLGIARNKLRESAAAPSRRRQRRAGGSARSR